MNGLPSIAQHLAAQGRNGDSVLVHMTPGEVRGLQAIAEQHGTSLTINPDTGLPEAFSLRSLLPMIAGIALTPVLGPMGAALAVGGGTTVATGDIKQGLMAGLGAYGGASLGAGLGAAGAAGAAVPPAIPPVPAPTIASALNSTTTIGSVTPGLTQGMTYDMAGNLMPVGSIDPNLAAANFPSTFVGPSAQATLPIVPPAAPPVASSVTSPEALLGESAGEGYRYIPSPHYKPSYTDILRGTRDVFSSGPTGESARSLLMSRMGGPQGLAMRAGAAALPGLMEQPKLELPEKEDPYANYEGPYEPSPRGVRYPTADELRRRRTSEFTYFNRSNPVPFQEGGNVGMNVTPAEADVYRNIANVQRAAGIPSIANMPMMVYPQRDMRGLVYNPVGYVPSGVPMGEQNFGFAPLMSREEAEKNFESIRRRMPNDGTSILREEEPQASGLSYEYSGFKRGGVPMLEDGGFVLTKKAVDGLGKGDNKKGQKVASAGLGAIPIKGPGHGTSDSIRTSIEGKQPALVSNGEAYVPRRSVQKNGGAKKFYALMKAAERRA